MPLHAGPSVCLSFCLSECQQVRPAHLATRWKKHRAFCCRTLIGAATIWTLGLFSRLVRLPFERKTLAHQSSSGLQPTEAASSLHAPKRGALRLRIASHILRTTWSQLLRGMFTFDFGKKSASQRALCFPGRWQTWKSLALQAI